MIIINKPDDDKRRCAICHSEIDVVEIMMRMSIKYGQGSEIALCRNCRKELVEAIAGYDKDE